MSALLESLAASGLARAEAAFLATNPCFHGLEELRAAEYGRLDATGNVYLDYTGGSLYAESQIEEHTLMLRDGVYGNPHSANPTSSAATARVEAARAAVLRHFVTWAATSHPAQHYLLVIWNHGSGWDDSNLYEGDYFSGAAPPVVRKGKVVARALVADSPGPIRMGTVRAAAQRARRSLFRSTVASMVTSRAIAFDDQAKDFLDNIE